MAGEDRSQQATPKRRQDARKHGQVVRSRELTGAWPARPWCCCSAGSAGVRVGAVAESVVRAARQRARRRTDGQSPERRVRAGGDASLRCWPPACAVVERRAAVERGARRLGVLAEAVQPNLERLNPVAQSGHSVFRRRSEPHAEIVASGGSDSVSGLSDWRSATGSRRWFFPGPSVRPLLGWIFSRAGTSSPGNAGWSCWPGRWPTTSCSAGIWKIP